MNPYKVIGLMSGTSLDGLDIALCHFWEENGKWRYEIKEATTVRYESDKQRMFNSMTSMTAEELAFHDADFGKFSGIHVNEFISSHKVLADFVSSHGHTVFHQPERGFTYQIGSGAAITAVTGLPVVSDFRSVDVSLGGQGAPLVPIGDKLLFENYEMCLNLGGIANISFQKEKKRIAFDICPVNIVLNELANQLGLEYDDAGNSARKGKTDQELLTALNALGFYKMTSAKSLGKERIEKEVSPLVKKSKSSVEDKLHTFCVHIAEQIGKVVIQNNQTGSMIITGGGAFNTFLIEKIREKSPGLNVIVPDDRTVMFKEALIFAFLGLLRVLNKVNSLSSVTGSLKDNIGGALYGKIPYS